MTAQQGAVQVGPKKLPVTVSHPDKVFWPDEGYTKLDVVEFYQSVFPRLLPFVNDRLFALERCPEGMRGECFFQKEKPNGMPPRTPTKRLAHVTGGKSTNYVVGGKHCIYLGARSVLQVFGVYVIVGAGS
jgi:DNA primase